MKDLRAYSNVLLVYNKYFYKEIELDEYNDDSVLLGNTRDSDMKLTLDCIHEVKIELECINNFWQIEHSEEVYVIINGVRVRRKILANGDQIVIKSALTNQELFKINYFIDFEGQKETYDRIVQLQEKNIIKIGKETKNNIIIDDDLVDREHCEIALGENKEYWIKDKKSKFGVFVNGIKVDGSVKLKDDDFIIICGYKLLYKYKSLMLSSFIKNIDINDLKIYSKEKANEILEYPAFVRSPRLISKLPSEEVKIEGVPTEEKKPNMGFIRSIATLGGMLLISSIFMKDNGGISSRIYFMGMMMISVIISVIVYIRDRINYSKKKKLREERYKEYIVDNDKKVEQKCKRQAEIMKHNNPETNECLRFMEYFDRRIWEREKDQEDFLNITLGRGQVYPSFKVSIPNKSFEIERDPLNDLPEEIKEKYRVIEDVPVGIDLKTDSSIGIIGKRENILTVTKNIIVRLATEHFYDDVKMVIIYPENETNHWKWARWLPHVWSEKRQIRYLAHNKDATKNVLNYLYSLIMSGDNEKRNYIFIIADRLLIENEAIMTVLEEKEKKGLSVIYAYENIEHIPEECTKVIKLIDGKQGEIITTDDADNIVEFKFSGIDEDSCEKFSKRMSPVYVKTSFTQSSMPKQYSLFDMYNIRNTSQLNIVGNWMNNEIYKSMAAPLGVNIGGDFVYLDIHEKFHGPHGLVAGTTGSGKSEILQTYIASLAINYHPYDLAIIIIDYKGGGMANLFRDLPHLVGTITNLDGNQINRSLICIKSELKRRQRIFAEYDVNHIDSYIKLFKQGKAKQPLPHLLLIADEFAELKNDQPDFMKELVSAARIGRSLGVHLILATQKPSGVVNDQIWSNSKFKLCLKVQTPQDSNEMIKSPLASEIVEPGRAYFQVGNNEIFELFQSAWSGAKDYGDDVNKKDFEISEVAIDGSRNVLYSTKDGRVEENQRTQLDSVIDAVSKICELNKIERLPGPWLPPLEEIIYLDDINNNIIDSKIDLNRNVLVQPIIGVVDIPEKQLKSKLVLNLGEDGHAFLVGLPSSGKTTMVQTIITSLMTSYTPNDVNIYILDFGARILKIFEKSPHVGGVMTADTEEYIENFFKYISKELARRKELFADEGVTSLYSYKEATGNVLPHIVIIFDNYSSFFELYEAYEDRVVRLSRDGGNLGISLVFTASSVNALRYKMVSNIKINIALNLADKGNYAGLLNGRPEILPADVKGRGLVKLETINEYQTALPIKGETESERSNNIKVLINQLDHLYKGISAVPIPIIPRILYMRDVEADMNRNNINTPYTYSMGMSVNELEMAYTSLLETPIVTIMGNPKMGKTNLLKAMISTINRNNDVNTTIIPTTRSDFNNFENIKQLFTVEEINEEMDRIQVLIDERLKYIEEELIKSNGTVKEEEILEKLPMEVLVIDGLGVFLEKINNDIKIIKAISSIMDKVKAVKISVIITSTQDALVANAYKAEFVKKIKAENVAFILGNLSANTFFEARLPFGTKEKKPKVGSGYFVTQGGYIKVKIPYFEE